MNRCILGLIAFVMLVEATCPARGDFITVTSTPTTYNQEAGLEYFSSSAFEFLNLQNYNTSATDSGSFSDAFAPGYSGTSSAGVSAQYSVTPTSFSAALQQTASLTQINPDSQIVFGSSQTIYGAASTTVSTFTVSISQPAVATITYDPTMTQGFGNLQFSNDLSGALSSILGYASTSVYLIGSGGSPNLEINGENEEQGSSQGLSSTSYLDAYIYNDGFTSNVPGESVTSYLPAGTYSIEEASSSVGEFTDGAIGTFSASTYGTAYITIDEVATPEPATLTLLGAGLLPIGMSRFRRRPGARG